LALPQKVSKKITHHDSKNEISKTHPDEKSGFKQFEILSLF